jgi:D-aspartate ligase
MVLSFVPKAVIKKYVSNDKLKEQIFTLMKKGRIVDPLNYKEDTNFKRKLWLFARKKNYIKKYKRNHW